MSQRYKFKSLQIAGNDKQKHYSYIDKDKLTVFDLGESKTIDFIQLDGTRQNFTYSHYLTAWIGKEKEERVIKIIFATHMVTIKGNCLDILYNELTTFTVKRVWANDERYSKMIDESKTFVSEIVIKWRGEDIGDEN